MTTPLEAATLYARRGFAVIPIPYKSKRAVLDGWQHLRLMEGDLAGHFAGNVNIGILTGEPSGWLVDVDCDSQEAVMVAPDFLPRTAMAHGHGTGGKARSKPRSHYWYRSHVAQTKKYQFPELDAAGARSPKPSMLVELRSSGCQTIVPPSVHPNGETLFWDRIWARDDSLNVADKIAPAEVTPADLERAVAKTAASALLARHWPGPGSRDIAALALCGMLARAGWSDGEIDHFATVTAQAAGDEQWRQRGKARHTREHLEAGKRVTGAPQLAGVLRDGQHVVDAVRLWLNLRRSSEREPANTPDDHLSEWEGGELLSTVTPQQVAWLWSGYIPLKKLTMGDGDPGLGKTMLFAADLTARVTTGGAMPDGTPGLDAPAGVVIFTAEDDPADTLLPRLTAAGGDPSKVIVVTTMQRTDTDPNATPGMIIERLPTFADLAFIERKIDQAGARLVIFDPYVAYLPPKVDNHRDQDVRSALAPLARLAQRKGVAVVLIRHLNRGNFDNALYRGMGSIGIVGASRAATLVVKHPDDENVRIFGSYKHNLSKPAPSWKFRIVENEQGIPAIVWEGPSDRDAQDVLNSATGRQRETTSKLEIACTLLREALADAPHAEEHLKELATEQGISKATLRRAKDLLGVQSEKVGFGRSGYWIWSLPTASAKGDQSDPEHDHTPEDDHLSAKPDDRPAQQADSIKGAHADGVGHVMDEGDHLSNGHKPAGICAVCGNLLDYADAACTTFLPCVWCAEAAAAAKG